ncbi:MAG: hypothetical protein ABSC36_03035 [Gaiellaceae bacterium]|jgi:hypothetical protein
MLVRAGLSKYQVARIAGIVVAALAVVVLGGWALDVDLLKRIWPGVPATKASAAIMFLVAGVGLAIFARAEPRRRERLLAVVAGWFCVVFSALTLVEYLWRDLGIDQALFRDTTGSPEPGRPSPHAAVGLLLVGVNLILLARSRKERAPVAAWINNLLAIVVMTGIIGYAYDVNYLRGFSSVNGIGVNALAGLTFMAIGLAALKPPGTWLAIFISPGAGGKMARRFAPLVVLSPVLIGIQTAVYDHPIGHAIAAVTVTTALVVTLLTGASAIDRAEAQHEVLSGLLPICAHCKRIRDDKGYWSQVESYVAEHSEAEFSHSLCPSCLREFYPEHAETIISQLEQGNLATSAEKAT